MFVKKGMAFPYPPYSWILDPLSIDITQLDSFQAHTFYRRVQLAGTGGAAQVFTFQNINRYYYFVYGLRTFVKPGPAGPNANLVKLIITKVMNERKYTESGTNQSRGEVIVNNISTTVEPNSQRYRTELIQMYEPGDQIQIRVTGHDNTDPEYIDIATDGMWLQDPRQILSETTGAPF